MQSDNGEVLSVLPDRYVPTILPGSRPPNVKLMKDGKQFPTLDLLEKEFVLLVGSQGNAWQMAANQLSQV